MPKAHTRSAKSILGNKSYLSLEEQALERKKRQVYSLDIVWPRAVEIALLCGLSKQWLCNVLGLGSHVVSAVEEANSKSPNVTGAQVIRYSAQLGIANFSDYFIGERHFDPGFSEVYPGKEQLRPHPLLHSGDSTAGLTLKTLLEAGGFSAQFVEVNHRLAFMNAAWREKLAHGEMYVTWLALHELLQWIHNMAPDYTETKEYKEMAAIRDQCPYPLSQFLMRHEKRKEDIKMQPVKKFAVDEVQVKPSLEPGMAQRVALNALNIMQGEWLKSLGMKQCDVLELADVPTAMLGELKRNKLSHILSVEKASNLADALEVPLAVLKMEEVPNKYFEAREEKGEPVVTIDLNDVATKIAVGWNIKTILHLFGQNYGWLKTQVNQVGYPLKSHISLAGLRSGRPELSEDLFKALVQVLAVSDSDLVSLHTNDERDPFWREKLSDRVMVEEKEAFDQPKPKAKSQPKQSEPDTPPEAAEKDTTSEASSEVDQTTAESQTDVSDKAIVWDGKKSVTIAGQFFDLRSKGANSARVLFARRVKERREKLEMSPAELADKTGVGYQVIYAIGGNTSYLDQDRAESYAVALGVTVPELFGVGVAEDTETEEVVTEQSETDSVIAKLDEAMQPPLADIDDLEPMTAEQFYDLVGQLENVPSYQLISIGKRLSKGEKVDFRIELVKLSPKLDVVVSRLEYVKEYYPEVYKAIAGLRLGDILD